ncbi:type I secretion system permease/ATPase [Rhodoligotrophos ferricapiens]|uniref:type I secretion system permease/ATPase n=1 Tax=Rhodoligotrophos ferricapiens TaxID=3069264 RepID=UPI00315D130E
MAESNRPGQILNSLKSWLFIAAFFSFCINILVLVSPLYSYQVFDRVLSSSHLDTLLYLTFAACFAFMVMSLIDSLRTCLLTRVGTRFEREIAPELVKVAVDSATTTTPLGTQPLRELTQIRNFVGGPLIAPLFDAPWTPFFTIVLWLVHPWLGMMTLFFAVVLLGLALANHRMQRVPSMAATAHLASAYRLAESAVRHAETVQAMGLFPNIMARWRASAEGALQVQEQAADRGAVINGISKFVRLVAQILVLGLGAYLVLTGQMSSGGMIAGSMILARALMPVEQSISAWRQFISAKQAFQTIKAAFEAAPQIKSRTKLPAPSGRIELERVVFQPHPNFPPIIKGASLVINPGEMLGVIGPSASGKTTICKLMIGILKPTAGSVRFDGADLAQWPHEDLGPYVGYLPQLVELFTGTVAENIARMGAPDPHKVVEAAKLAGVHDLILRLPAGYDTPVGEGGVQLSGGQRQRVGLARAVFGHPRILLLDEPNANLDAEGETVLINSLEKLKQNGITIIVVAHRPVILTPADRLMVMSEGQIAMVGPRDEVMAKLTGATATPAPAPAPASMQPPIPGPMSGPSSGPMGAPGVASGPGSILTPGVASGPGSMLTPGVASGPGSILTPGVASGPGAMLTPGVASGPGSILTPGVASGPGAMLTPGVASGPGSILTPGAASGSGAIMTPTGALRPAANSFGAAGKPIPNTIFHAQGGLGNGFS